MSPVHEKPVLHGRDHCHGGADPIPCLPPSPGGDTIDEIILGLNPDGFWKLDESSGDTAADSSGGSNDLVAAGAEVDPDWAQPAGPPGTQTASFEIGTSGVGGTASRVSRSWEQIDYSFTAGIWALRNVDDPGGGDDYSMLIGQGNPERGSGVGWMLGITSTPTSPSKTPYLRMGVAGTDIIVNALNPLTVDTWAFLAVVYNTATTTAKLYVNGLLQAESAAFTFEPSTDPSPLWIGHDGALGASGVLKSHATCSYGFLVPSVLTGTQLLDMYESAADPPSQEGFVLTATAGGTAEWAAPSFEVTY